MTFTFSGVTIAGGWTINSTFVPDAPILAQETLVCATASEGNNLSISAPTGAIFTSIQFASYGTPSGTCGLYTTGGCNSSNSVSVVRSALIGNTGTQTIAATNVNFGGDPCSGTAKNLYVAAYTGSAIATSATTANIVFTAPTNSGSSTITSYTATSSPGGITGTVSQAGSGTITVSGLSPSTSYTFTVTATNSDGTSVASQPSNSITTNADTLSVEMLVVAGGGGAGNSSTSNLRGRAGGGGGGLLYSASRNLLYGTNYTVTVGGGGAAGATGANYGAPGENSSFSGSDFTATAIGGGGGSNGSTGLGTGGSGGSGGGGGGFFGGTSTSGGSATQTDSGGLTGYGNNGGGGSGSASVYGAGGGGGAGTAGITGTSTKSGNGGDGRQYDISGTNTYYAGGGGSIGSASGTAASGSAGLGGGGAANTGGGGGGASNADNRVGGSGIVIIRYPDTYPAASSTVGLAAGYPTVSGGYRTYLWNSSGSITF
jgi:hypothetical protein